MFPGQGAQYYHMGKELYQYHPRFKLWMDYCNEIVHPLIQTSLIDVIYKEQVNKYEPFDQILYTNPALLSIEYSLARLLMEMNIQPNYVLGYSLGEITAAIISNAISLEEGLRLVIDVAKIVETQTRPACLLAIIESIKFMTRFPDMFQNCWITGKNCQKNFVVGGLNVDIRRLQKALEKKKIISQELPVKYGFHTELMDPIREKIKLLIQRINLDTNRIPIISSLETEEIQEVSEAYVWEVFRYPVDFEKTIRLMLQKKDYIFIDVGPSGSLATFVKYLLPRDSESLHLEMMNQFGQNINSMKKLMACLSIGPK